ncbi:carboxyl-terminal processing protease [Thermoflexales bacterium]|nr:carboxyl-terminal processing protease [Thermoflexales bacterium]
MRISFRRIAGFLLIGLIVELAFFAGIMLSPQLIGWLPGSRSSDTHAPLLEEAWEVADSQFYGELPTEQVRTYGAVRGMMESFKDPYSVFVEPPQTELQSQQLSGKFGGIGASVRRETDGRYVLSPFPDRPAAQVGVQEGDVLVKVDDTPITIEMRLEDITSLLRGEVGTQVKVEIERVGQQLAFNITRAEISTPSVTWRILSQAPDVGYVRLNIFSQTSKDELVSALEDLRKQGAKKLIFDLRDNGGGLLDASIEVASQFIDGKVVSEKRRVGGPRDYTAEAGGVARDLPLVVLVNGSTASASEIVAGAIQDLGRGVLVGTKTYGKGSVQNVIPLSDGSSLHVTVAEWLTPNGRQLTGQGLQPEVVVELTGDDVANGRDPQLDRAITAFR